MQSCNSRMQCFEFTREEINAAVKERRLLSLEIEFSLRCNFHCQFCYLQNGKTFNDELSKEELRDVILQAEQLGAKKIIILGGEPMVYPHILEMIKFIRDRGLNVEMFTNGSDITLDVARQLFDYDVHVVLKMNSFNENIQDMLAGFKGASKIIWEAFHNLKQAGYPSKSKLLSVSTVICKHNIDELLSMWQWLREQDISPYFEMLTPQGRAKQNEWLDADLNKVHDLFNKISEIDRSHYGYIWDPQPPLVANRCLRHQFSCLVNSKGYVMPCVGIPIPVGNIRERKLADIIHDSEVIQDLRDYRKTIKEPCRSCEKLDNCYGCRGSAYQLTGDYLASDPLCWKNINRQEEIVSLPVSVDTIIPQQTPMRIIDTLESIGERAANVKVTVSKDMPFVRKDGTLDEIAYMELMAQGMAAFNGFKQMDMPEKKLNGFLLGAKNLDIFGEARVGDVLSISVFKYARYDNFGIIKGSVYRNDQLLAQGDIKIWHDTREQGEDTPTQ